MSLLLVGAAPDVIKTVSACADGQYLDMIQVSTLAKARAHLAQFPMDLALIDSNLSDADAVKLISEMAEADEPTQSIILSSRPTYKRAVRAGASDLIRKPIDHSELAACIAHAIDRYRAKYAQQRRISRLRRACRKLNHMRRDVKEQADVLCQDLVAAYQELAVQMNNLVQTSEYASLIRQELNLEEFLRRTLEFMLQKVGPTNAAAFLPSIADEYTIGGYVNYDYAIDSAEILLQHLADVVAPRVAQRDKLIHITDNATLSAWMGGEVSYLEDSHMVAFPCWHEQEALSAVLLFRHRTEPFQPNDVEICASIAPLLGEYLAKLIRVHHRIIEVDDDFENQP